MKKIWAVLIAASLLLILSPDCQAAPIWGALERTGSMPLQYAAEFCVDYYGPYSLIQVADGCRYLVVPEEEPVPEGLEDGITVLQQPINRIYIMATSAMDLYRAIGGIDRIRFSCLQESGWYVEEAAQAMAEGRILYAGKYSAPDYELLCSEGCGLAVHSTMAYHNPEIRELLELLEIPMFIERSSRETHPLGRMEWMKAHALILGKLEEAEAVFDRELEALRPILEQDGTGKTVAFFSVNDDETVSVRKSEDYISKTISMAGGRYIYDNLGGDSNAQTTQTLTMEHFYSTARDADVLICSSTMTSELKDRAELLNRSNMLSDFSAFREGNVWCTRQSLFQSGMGMGEFLMEIHSILTGSAPDEMTFLYRLK